MRQRTRWVAIGVICGALLALLAYFALRPGTRPIGGEGFQGVIFGRKAAAEALGSMVLDDATEYWTPTRDDIRELEHRLSAYVSREEPGIARWLPQYRRQYFGFTRRDARRVYIVGFCDTDDLDWTREFVSTAAGGDCHFEAEYDASARRVAFFWALE